MALKIDVMDVSNALDSLEAAVRAVRERLSVNDLLDLCTAAAVGRTGLCVCMSNRLVTAGPCVCAGMPGGLLFENFIATSGKRASRRALGTCQRPAPKKTVCVHRLKPRSSSPGSVWGSSAGCWRCWATAVEVPTGSCFSSPARAGARHVANRHGAFQRRECVPATPNLRPRAGHFSRHRR